MPTLRAKICTDAYDNKIHINSSIRSVRIIKAYFHHSSDDFEPKFNAWKRGLLDQKINPKEMMASLIPQLIELLN